MLLKHILSARTFAARTEHLAWTMIAHKADRCEHQCRNGAAGEVRVVNQRFCAFVGSFDNVMCDSPHALAYPSRRG